MTTYFGESHRTDGLGRKKKKNRGFRRSEKELRNLRENRKRIERPCRVRFVRALDPNAAIRCAGNGNAERVRVNYGYVFVMARSVVMVSPWLVNVLERPHGKSQKEGHTNLQSGSTTNHLRIMPYKVRRNQGYKLPARKIHQPSQKPAAI